MSRSSSSETTAKSVIGRPVGARKARVLLGVLVLLTMAPTASAQNRSPEARDDTATTLEDTLLELPAETLLANDRGPVGDPLAIVSVGPASDGVATLTSGGDVTYLPDPDVNGTDAFTYTVSDSRGRTSTATVTVTVRPVNDSPTALADAAATTGETPIIIDVLANDSDADGDALVVTSVTDPASGTAAITAGGAAVRYTPGSGFSGDATFTYTVSDGNGGTATASVTVAVTLTNRPPQARPDAATTAEDTPTTVDVLANDSDADGDALLITDLTAPTHGSAVVQEGQVLYTPASDFNGSDAFSYTVSDGEGGTASAAVAVAVTAVNDRPVARNDAATVDEDGQVALAVLANDSDVDGDALAVTSVTDPANGTTSTDGATVTYVPDADFNGTDAFSYTVGDGNGGTASATVAVTVTAVNDAPTARDDDYAMLEDLPLTVTPPGVLGNDSDPDGDPLRTVLAEGPLDGTVTLNQDGSFTYTPDADFTGNDRFRYRATDGVLSSPPATVTIAVGRKNDAPVAQDDEVTTDEDTAITVRVLGNDRDPDGDALTIGSFTRPSNGEVAVEGDEALRYTPAPDFNGTDSFTYTVSDGNGATATATVAVTVRPVNDAPVARDDAAGTAEGTPVDIDVLVNDSDADGDALALASTTTPDNGTAAIQEGRVRYTPRAGFSGTDSFTYTVSDGNGGTASATVTVAVNVENTAPIAVDDAASTDEGVPVTVDVLANDTDADGDALQVASVTAPANGEAAIPENGASVTYTPDPGFDGSDSFTYTVSDGRGGATSAAVAVTVRAASGSVVEASVVGEAEVGSDAAVSVSVSGFEPTSAELLYRLGGDRTFIAVPLAQDGDVYTGAFPASAVTLRGIDYYVSLSDGTTTVTDPATAPESAPRHLRVQIAEADAPVRYASDGLRMLSLPVDLDAAAPSSVFVDDYGTYDPLVWRLFRWLPQEGRYAEYPDADAPLAPGVGFWLAAREGSGFDIEDARSVAATAPAILTLQPGWNQIGSPFAFPVAWEDVGGHEAVSPPAAWDGQEYALDQAVLQPWEGYFVENPTDGPVELAVPPTAADPASLRRASATDAAGYRLRLRAESGDFRDTQNVLGFAEGAAPGRDRFDLAEPPPPGDHVRLSLMTDGVRLARSLQPDRGGAAWEADVSSTPGLVAGGPRTVAVTLQDEAARPAGYGLYVLDLDRGTALPLTGDRFEVTLTPSEPARRLRVIVGTEAFAETAAQGLPLTPPGLALEPAHPNPFRTSAAVAYRVPESGPVTLDVLDLLGRRVAVLVDGVQDAGRHTAEWDTGAERSLAAGVYVLRLRAGGLTATEKVTLIR